MASKAELEARRLKDAGRNEAYAKYGIPSNFALDAKNYAKIQSGETTWDAVMSKLAGKPIQIGTATGTYGGPGGNTTFTTAPGTVGSTLTGTSGGGSGSGTSGVRDAAAEAAIKRLEATGSGESLPMDEAQKARMLSSQSDMTAAAEAQQQAALRRTVGAGGGSLYDPSTGAAEREFAADRQAGNQLAKRDIDTSAQAQNWEAQFAANRLLAAQGGSGGGNDASNPYGEGGRYGQASQQPTSTDPNSPQRGGNIRSYGGSMSMDPNKLRETGGQTGMVGQDRYGSTTQQNVRLDEQRRAAYNQYLKDSGQRDGQNGVNYNTWKFAQGGR
jgi:hypothetical protein